MATSHLEKLPFLTFENIDYIFALSLDSLNGLIADDRPLLSSETVKDVVQCHLWFALEKLYDAELPKSMQAPEVGVQCAASKLIPPWALPQPGTQVLTLTE